VTDLRLEEALAYHFLREHYRSHPDITEFPNSAFYKDKMINHESTMAEHGLHKTLSEFFKTLGPAWNKRWRMAIDISHEGAESKTYGNMESLYNDGEADIIVRVVVKLLKFVPSSDNSGAVRVEPEHISIFTPYEGQVRTLAKKLRVPPQQPVHCLVEGCWGSSGFGWAEDLDILKLRTSRPNEIERHRNPKRGVEEQTYGYAELGQRKKGLSMDNNQLPKIRAWSRKRSKGRKPRRSRKAKRWA
jgi:hypothetical protein